MRLWQFGRSAGLAVTMAVLATAGEAQSDRGWFELKAKELRASARVVMISYAPLCEDARSAVRLRRLNGASMHLAYLTNGEGTALGPRVEYPHQVAARLRSGAAKAAEHIDADHTFLNMPHVDAASDSATAWTLWNADTLRARLYRLLEDVRPDAILVAGFEHPSTPGVMEPLLRETIADVLREIQKARLVVPDAVAFAHRAESGPASRTSKASVRSSRTVEQVIEEYWSQYGIAALPRDDAPRSYTTLAGYPRKSSRATTDPASLLQRRRSRSIRTLDSMMVRLSGQVGRWTRPRNRAAENSRIRTLVDALGAVDRWTDDHPGADPVDRRVVLDWRLTLEALRLRTMNVQAFTRVSDSILTPRQLTYLTIDSIQGLDPKGRTEVFFPKAKEGWILNERPGDRAALVLGQPYRLVSPLEYPADLPRDLDGLERSQIRTPWHYFVVHWAPNHERSFSLKLDAGFLGAPRFSAEVKNPVIMASDRERLVVQLTNHTRDGVRDTLSVRTEHVTSEPLPFRLHAKGVTVIDTLALTIAPSWSDGSYLLPVTIGRDPVARFLVRKFSFRADSVSPNLVIASDAWDATSQAVRRLGVRMRSIHPSEVSSAELGSYRAAVLSEQVASDLSDAAWKRVAAAVEAGLHLIVLWQPPEGMGRLPGAGALSAAVVADLDTSIAIAARTDDPIWSVPNDLREEGWDGWLFRRSGTAVTADPTMAVLATYGVGKSAAVLRWSVGKGTVHYVNMNLSHQFLNVLPSAYQLLANLLAY